MPYLIFISEEMPYLIFIVSLICDPLFGNIPFAPLFYLRKGFLP